MTKHSAFERVRRAAERERVIEIERAWRGSIPADVAAKFDAQVRAARERGPRPPRPGHEPKPPKAEERPRRGR